ncbi:uncharacterized protein C8Q71DRAFT_727261 [Rhodofomes roseus]|uniref:DUF6533 domain-containing protein n=2 Tax=Rhodofomes roseus TaxID=34475 RepID=A0ABQ8K234_9APHY|nr:uncharacterized protein C8Q71DRAFT_727261 [Rhodofomes roseus]KAH9830788.1 hypothetical protein C8Q71DRAFT_727261 [Rhodofomes roseus]
MSFQAEAELLALLHTSFVTNCAQVAVAALVAYEYVFTLDQAINFIWSRRNPSLYVFLLNQCVMLGLVIANILEMLPWVTSARCDLERSCQAIGIVYDILQLLTFLEWAVISALRAQAVSRSSRMLPALVFALDLVPFGTTMVQSRISSFGRIFHADLLPTLVSSRACAMAADIIVVLATWYYSRGPELMPQVFGFRTRIRLPALLLRNGVTYSFAQPHDGPAHFTSLGVLYFMYDPMKLLTAQIIMNYIEALSIGTVFLIPVMSVLVSRFLLNIREAADEVHKVWDTALEATLEDTESTGLSFQLQNTNNTTADCARNTPALTRSYDLAEGSSTAVGSAW